ncbi:hypothetical protein KDW54_06755 [Burkholderia ambifaria]|uniref:NUMOD3 domain-containing DNA-binding protein n=1 Tax=Burkholderia ambifaria TaxID=152480 RepID=UPI001BA33203|nr:NUMOD3 domain-containing DNA-binding protein [Burkholderia ambifaria]MBR8182098.1 hypothetical protein [Burkholderia ambifaria]
MNYQKIYDRLMARAVGRSIDGYTESHHVVPRCMGGTDATANLVRLTPEEHYVAHQLLVRIYPVERGLVFAMMSMCWDRHGDRLNNKMFGWVRRRVAEAIRLQKTGVACPPWVAEKIRAANKGKPVPQERREKHSKALKGRAHTPEHNAKVGRKGRVSPMQGRTHSEETKAKMRAAATGRKMKPEDVVKMVQNKTPEQRRAQALKAWETKRAKKAAAQSE